MRVLRVISSMNPTHGGPCQGIRNSIPQFQSMGIESDVVCLDNANADFLNKDPFKIIALGPGITPWQYAAALKVWLLQNLKNYDVVIVHGIWQYHAYAVHLAIKSLKKSKKPFPKVYVMTHGMLDPYFQNAPDRKVKALRNKLFWILFEKHIINQANGVLFTCEEELILARKTFKNYSPKAEINVGYGIQKPDFEIDSNDWYQLYPQLKEQSYLLFLSRIHIKKGVDILLNAFEAIYKESTEKKYLVIAGPGMDTDYGHTLNQIIEKSEFLKERVIFTGMLKGNRKWEAFVNCEAFILPSHQENFGIAVAESLACKKAVLISNKVNIWREIANENAGLIAADNLEGTKSLLKQWNELTNEQKLVLGENAEKCFQNLFTIESACNQMATKLNLK